MEEAATPFPSEETTPPVTKIYFGAILSSRWLAGWSSLPGLFALHRSDVHIIMFGTRGTVNATPRGIGIKNLLHRISVAVSLWRRAETFVHGWCCYGWENFRGVTVHM